MDLDVPIGVVIKARAVGVAGEQWLRDLPTLVERITATWQIRPGPILGGGSAGLVLQAGDGVLKVGIPEGGDGQPSFDQELTALLLGAGTGYVKVIRYDRELRAMLLERLGSPLSRSGLSPVAQCAAIATTLAAAWRPVPDQETATLPTGAAKARWLADFIARHGDLWSSPRTVDRAVSAATSFDPPAAVLVHGDAHSGNVLSDPHRPGEFKLIDPEGLVSEPAHDLAIPLRQFGSDGLSGDALVDRALTLCSVLAETAGVAARPIWEWAFVERVSTGLYMLSLGLTAEGNDLMTVADQLVDVRI